MMNANVKKPNKTLMVPLCTYRKRLMKGFISLGVLQKVSTELRDFGMFRATEDQHFTLLHIGLRGQLIPLHRTGKGQRW